MSRPPTDRERQYHVSALQQAATHGRIDLADFEQRVVEVLQATAIEEIERITGALHIAPLRFVLRGVDGDAVLERDRVVLHFAKRVLTNRSKSVRSPRVLPLAAISSVDHRAGRYLQFRLAGEAPWYQPRDAWYDIHSIQLRSSAVEHDWFVAEVQHRIALEPRTPDPVLLPPQARQPGLAAPPWGELSAGLPAGYRRREPRDDPDSFEFSTPAEEGVAEDLAAHVAARITGHRVVDPRLLPGNPAVPIPVQLGNDAPTQLRELARLRAEGLITDADFDTKKQEILGRW